MKQVEKTTIPLLYSTILYICGLLLFLEWIYSVDHVTDTGSIYIFIFYTVFCFLISLFRFPKVPSFVLKGFGLLFVMNELFMNTNFLGSEWWGIWFSELSLNLQLLFTHHSYELTPFFRSVLFLTFIWLMSYFIYFWFVVVKRLFVFILLTFIYLTLLDTFTVYDASIPIIRTFIYSLFAFGIANYSKQLLKESLPSPSLKQGRTWLLSLLSIILFSLFVGYLSPKYEPQWADPVPFIKHAAGQSGFSNQANKRVGYGEDDTSLGGSFVQDETPIFHVAADEKQYWRIETKDVYTGKGWVSSEESYFEEQQNGLITFRTFFKAVGAQHSKATVTFLGNTYMNKLVYPYGISQVYTEEERVQFLLDRQTERIFTEIDGEEVNLSTYTMTYETPSYSVETLQQTHEEDPDFFIEHYTQLPDELPERIAELAEEITSPSMSRYDKVVEIEQYFGQNGFVYQTSNVPIPGDEDDYVDQFLFDTRAGYCDNYSTTMVVMLRTLDIPARWVKGFTGGEKIDEIDNGNDTTNIYEVKSANAHSWVEVFFPEVGWVPFEPTQGFSSLADFHVNIDEDEQELAEEEQNEEIEQQEEPEMPILEEDQDQIEAVKEGEQQVNRWYIGTLIIVLALLIFVIYKWRDRLKTWVLSNRFKRGYNTDTVDKAYHHLLTILSKQGIPKRDDQTLREYAKQVDDVYNIKKMGQLTNYYEQIIYTNNELSDKNEQKLVILWKDLMKRIAS